MANGAVGRVGKAWTLFDDATLREMVAQRLRRDGVARALNRTVGSVRERARYLGLKFTHYRPNGWSAAEDEQLRMFAVAGRKRGEAAHYIGRSRMAIDGRVSGSVFTSSPTVSVAPRKAGPRSRTRS